MHSAQRSFPLLALTLAISAQALAQGEASYSAVHTLDQMVVSATKTANTVAEAPASISVISRDEILSQPTLALNEIVERAVGVESRKESGRAGRESISIRGMDSSYTLILVNGRRMSSSNAITRGNDFDLSTIPVENIEQIEVIRGPMSALYGSEALGGVVNIITNLPNNDWRTTFNGDMSGVDGGKGGTQSTIGLDTGGALIDDKLYLNLAINKSDREAWKPYSGERAGFDRSAVTALEERDSLSVSSNLNWLINDEQSLDFDLSYSDDKRNGAIESASALTQNDQRVKRYNAAITHNGDWTFGSTQVRYYREQVELSDYDFTALDYNKITEINDTFDANMTVGLGDHRITFGGDIRRTELDNPRDLDTTTSSDVLQKALYIQDEWQLAERWTLTYGARLDHHENFGEEISPRAYLVHNMTDNLTIKGGVGTAFKAPSLLRLNSDYRLSSCKGGCWILGNPDLKPETSTSYELAASYQQPRWSMEAAVFQNDIDNLIERDLDTLIGFESGRNVFTYKNVAEAQIRGLELSAQIALLDSLSLNGNYTYTDARDISADERLTDRPRQNASATLNWQTTNQLSSFARVNYTGQQKINDTIDLKGYSTVNVGVNYQLSPATRIRAGVNNVGNKSLPYEVSILGYSEEPRTGYVGITTTF